MTIIFSQCSLGLWVRTTTAVVTEGQAQTKADLNNEKLAAGKRNNFGARDPGGM